MREGGRGRTNRETEQESKQERAVEFGRERESWIRREGKTNQKIGERVDSKRMQKKERVRGKSNEAG